MRIFDFLDFCNCRCGLIFDLIQKAKDGGLEMNVLQPAREAGHHIVTAFGDKLTSGPSFT